MQIMWKKDETVAHIVGGCEMLENSDYLDRNNRIASQILVLRSLWKKWIWMIGTIMAAQGGNSFGKWNFLNSMGLQHINIQHRRPDIVLSYQWLPIYLAKIVKLLRLEDWQYSAYPAQQTHNVISHYGYRSTSKGM